MRRRVRVDDGAFEAVAAQLEGTPVTPEVFVALDLARVVDHLADHYDLLPTHGPGRRVTQQEPETVALFHVFAALEREDSVVVYHVDIWVGRAAWSAGRHLALRIPRRSRVCGRLSVVAGVGAADRPAR